MTSKENMLSEDISSGHQDHFVGIAIYFWMMPLPIHFAL